MSGCEIRTKKEGKNLPVLQVTRKDSKEALENMIRRFNCKVQQSGTLAKSKDEQYFSKPLSKTERRKKAIVRNQRRADKVYKTRMGIR